MTKLTSKSAAYIHARTKLGDGVRKIFDNVGAALVTLTAIYKTPVSAEEGKEPVLFPADFPVVAAGVGLIDVSGDGTMPPLSEWPAEYSTPGVQVAIAFIGVRGLKDSDGKDVNGARGLLVYPLHPLEAIQADESGLKWLLKIAEKESSHVAMRKLRNVPDGLGVEAIAAAAKTAPVSVAEFVEESAGESLDTAAFDKLWKTFRTLLKNNAGTAVLEAMLPQKGEVIKSIRSKAFAAENFAEIENIGGFTFIGTAMAGVIDSTREDAIKKGEEFEYDSQEIRGWLAGRDTFVFPAARKVEGDLTKVDFSAFAGLVGATDQA